MKNNYKYNLHIFLIIIFSLLILMYFSINKKKTGISIVIKDNENDKIKNWLNKLNIIKFIEIRNFQSECNISLKKMFLIF